MTPDIYPCPECHAKLRGSADLQPGDLVQCPRCGTQFPIPEEVPPLPLEKSAPSPAAPPVEDTDYSDRPGPRARPRPSALEDEVTETGRRRPDRDLDDDDYPRPPGGRGQADFLRDTYRRPEDLSSDYTIDLGLWFRYATAHWNTFAGPAAGFLLVYSVIQFFATAFSFFPCLGPIAAILILPPLQAGVTVVALAQLKGQRWDFSHFFSGFQWYGAILCVQLLLGFFAGLFGGLFFILMLVMENGHRHRQGPGSDQQVLVLLGVSAVLGFLGVYLLTRSFFFAWQLIIDRNYGPIEAIRGSWALTRRHFWPLLGVGLVLALINLGGMLLFLVGLLVTLPLTALVSNAGYLLIAGTRPPLPEPRPPVGY